MPRRIASIATIESRNRGGQQRPLKNPFAFIDPFPEVHGTLPEKMVYAKLSFLGIPFLFLNDVTINIPEIAFLKDYQADFIIPDLKIIIEVQGAHWHSMPATIDADAYKFALYQTMGYKPLAWWDYEIISDIDKLVFNEPALYAYARPNGLQSKELPVVKRTKVDTSKGIRTLNERRYHEKSPTLKRRKIRKAIFSYAK